MICIGIYSGTSADNPGLEQAPTHLVGPEAYHMRHILDWRGSMLTAQSGHGSVDDLLVTGRDL